MLTPKEVPLDSITLREEFKRGSANPAKQEDLVRSIKARGILYPLICIETQEGLTLIAGYRRHWAAKELGLATVPCICLSIGIDDAEILRLHENLYREDITPVAEAEAMARLEITYHFTRSKIAQLLGKSAAYVTQRLQIRNWHTDLKRALSLDQINYSVARELSVVTDPNNLRFMIEQIVSSGASVRTVATWVQEWKATLSNLPEGIKPLQPTAETKPASTDAINCYFCAEYIGPGEVTRIDVCRRCLKKIEPTQN